MEQRAKIRNPSDSTMRPDQIVDIRLQNFSGNIELSLAIERSDFTGPLSPHKLQLEPGDKSATLGRRELKSVKLDGQDVPSHSTASSSDEGDTVLKLDMTYKRQGSILGDRRPIEIPIAHAPGERIWIEISGVSGPRWPKKFELLCRQQNVRDKFLEFLEWQYPLIYGPPARTRFEDGVYRCESDWERHAKKPGKPLMISGTGLHENCFVCSPFAGQFLGYWLNYHKSFEFTDGGDLNKIRRGYSPFLQRVPRAGGGSWRWRPFLRWLDRETDAAPGTIYVCGSGTHVWMIVRFGRGFNFPKKYIFGDRATGECDEGWYKIHASGPSVRNQPNLIFKSYTRSFIEDRIERFRNRRNPDARTSLKTFPGAVDTFAEIANCFESELVRAPAMNNVKVFRGTPLFWMNGRVYVDDTPRKADPKIVFALDASGNEVPESQGNGEFDAFRVLDVLNPDSGMVDETKVNNNEQREYIGRDCRPIVFG